MKLRTWCIRIGHFLTKTGLGVKNALLLMLVCLAFAGSSYAEIDTQGITIRQQNVTLEKVFQAIEKQSGYRFFYNESLLEGAGKVSLNLQNVSLQEALDACFRDQPFTYKIVEKTIIIKRKEIASVPPRTVSTAPFNKIIAVRGKVTSGDNPVVGATVTIKGTDNATSTDNEGGFTLPEVDDQSTLVVSHVSHQVREVKLNGQTFISIDLNEKVNELEESIVVAYSVTNKKRNTGSVSVVKGDVIESLPNRSFDRSLQGKVPGLLITTGSGMPGGGLSNMVLRGIGTGTNAKAGSTVRNPLILIDGVPVNQDNIQDYSNFISNPLAQINPSDIESLTVLKDASAIALYGSKASNGVILVTTKRGKSGKTTISFSNQTDITKRVKGNVEVLNKEQYLELLLESYKNVPGGSWSDESIKTDLFSKFPTYNKSVGDTMFYDGPNWFKELFSDISVSTSNNISFSGGKDKSLFFLNLEYTDQDGVIKNTGFDRTSARFNFSNQATPWLNIGVNSSFSYNKQDFGGTLFESIYEPQGFAYAISPLLPLKDQNDESVLVYGIGNPYSVFSSTPNPVLASNWNINRVTAYRGLGNFSGEISFLKYFKLRSILGVDFMLANTKRKVDMRLSDIPSGSSTGKGFVSEYDLTTTSIITTNTLQYDQNIFNKHHINFLIGQEARTINSRYISATATNFTSPYYDQLINGSVRNVFNGISKETLSSYFSQFNYDLNAKYFATLSVRRDGSSKFGERERYGNYWSVGLGWLVSDEFFLKTMSWINYFKIRGSIGTSGNSGTITSTTRFNLLNPANYGNTNPPSAAAVPASPGNPDIKWEETFNSDIGIEGKLFNNRIGFTVDVYKRKISNLIYPYTLPGATGWTSIVKNIGDMQNQGVEISLSVDVIRTPSFQFNVDINWSKNKNKLLKANQPLAIDEYLINKEGENFNSFYLRKWAGVDQETGKPLWIDSTGKLSSDYSAAKREIVGKPQPDGFGGITPTINFRGFECAIFFYYQYGFQINDLAQANLNNDGANNPYINQSTKAFDRWQKPGDIAQNPRRILNNTDGGGQPSTRFLFDGDYIRLNNIYLSYSFNKTLINRLKISNLKIYIQANNIAYWSKYPGIDPGNVQVTGDAQFAYPQMKSLSLGLRATL